MPASFSDRLLRWFDQHGRHDLPWQLARNAYRVWVSEVMLQQTQVVSVIPYFERFMRRFPELADLAKADLDSVLEHWAGLGYYSRARNLHKAARMIVAQHAGVFPQDLEAVQALPGIGPSTAAAILAQAHGQRHAILDGNVKRVLSRYHAVEGWAGQKAISTRLWQLAEEHTPHSRLADYTQAIMDLGATLCTRSKPRCTTCPLVQGCQAYRQGRIDELPTPRPKRLRPQRLTRMLVIGNEQGEILLQKRPPMGIWGGLWSLPELPEDREPVDFCARELALSVGPASSAEPVKHGFTHFELTIEPLVVRVAGNELQVQEDEERQWYKPDNPESAPALPAPLSRLLHGKMIGSMLVND